MKWNNRSIRDYIDDLKRVETKNKNNLNMLIELWEERLRKVKDYAPPKDYKRVRRSRFSDADVLKIRALKRGGMRECDIAKKYNSHPSGINAIVRYKSYKHLP